ncbi:MAG: cysteine hydrolase family protein, partial [Hyphomicrobiaceae bacterium]
TAHEAWLRARDIRHQNFTGVATNVCVESSARDAYFAEFWPVLVEDAMNHSGPDFTRQATLWNFEHVLGWVTRTDTLVAALEAKALPPA